MTIREGGCFCGAVRYRIEGEPTSANHCHCRMCQRSAGAPVVTWVTAPTDRVKFVKGAPRLFESSARASRGYCADCGTQLTFHGKEFPDEVDITAASLDDPNSVTPADHTWTESRLAWMVTGDTLPTHRRSRREG